MVNALEELLLDYRKYLKLVEKTRFRGKDLITFIVTNPFIRQFRSRSALTNQIRDLFANPAMSKIYILDSCGRSPFKDDNTQYTFLDFLIKEEIKDPYVLNCHLFENLFRSDLPVFYSSERWRHEVLEEPMMLINKIMGTIKEIVQEFVSPDGLNVDYRNLKKSYLFITKYTQLINFLPFVDPEPLMRNQDLKRAFFINIYNAMVIHLITKHYDPHGKEICFDSPKFKKLKETCCYNIAGANITLKDIKKLILNNLSEYQPHNWLQKTSSAFKNCFTSKKNHYSNVSDLKSRFKADKNNNDPRVCLCLYDFTILTPGIQFYTPENLSDQLNSSSFRYFSRTSSSLHDAKHLSSRIPKPLEDIYKILKCHKTIFNQFSSHYMRFNSENTKEDSASTGIRVGFGVESDGLGNQILIFE